MCRNPKVYLLQVENNEWSEGEVEEVDKMVLTSEVVRIEEQEENLEVQSMPSRVLLAP